MPRGRPKGKKNSEKANKGKLSVKDHGKQKEEGLTSDYEKKSRKIKPHQESLIAKLVGVIGLGKPKLIGKYLHSVGESEINRAIRRIGGVQSIGQFKGQKIDIHALYYINNVLTREVEPRIVDILNEKGSEYQYCPRFQWKTGARVNVAGPVTNDEKTKTKDRNRDFFDLSTPKPHCSNESILKWKMKKEIFSFDPEEENNKIINENELVDGLIQAMTNKKLWNTELISAINEKLKGF